LVAHILLHGYTFYGFATTVCYALLRFTFTTRLVGYAGWLVGFTRYVYTFVRLIYVPVWLHCVYGCLHHCWLRSRLPLRYVCGCLIRWFRLPRLIYALVVYVRWLVHTDLRFTTDLRLRYRYVVVVGYTLLPFYAHLRFTHVTFTLILLFHVYTFGCCCTFGFYRLRYVVTRLRYVYTHVPTRFYVYVYTFGYVCCLRVTFPVVT